MQGSIRMVALVATVFVALVAAAITAGASQAASTGYTCKFRVASGIYAVLWGSDLGPAMCRSFGGGTVIRTSYVPSRSFCIYQMRGMDILVSVRATTALMGRYACSYIGNSSLKGWTRIA